MLFLIFELAMFGGGFYTLFTGKIPGFLIGYYRSESYEVSKGLARFLGFLMILPLPLAFVTDIMIGLTMDPSLVKRTALFAEVAIVVGTAILVPIIYLIAWKPVPMVENETDSSDDKIKIADDISQQVNLSLSYALLGLPKCAVRPMDCSMGM